MEEDPVSAQDLIRWSEALSGIARTGLGFTESLYERERFEEVLKVAADIRVAAGHELEAEVLLDEWMKMIGSDDDPPGGGVVARDARRAGGLTAAAAGASPRPILANAFRDV